MQVFQINHSWSQKNCITVQDLSIKGLRIPKDFLYHAFPHTELEFTFADFKDMFRNG